MNWMEQYYTFCGEENKKKPSSNPEKAKAIVFSIMNDFLDRRGLKQSFYEIDTEIQEEIIENWYLTTLKILAKKGTA